MKWANPTQARRVFPVMLLLAAALACSVSAATAQTGAANNRLCARPAMPACIDDLTTFVSADRMIECQTTVKDYIEATMAYLACTPAGDVATNEEMIQAVNRFSCRLMGGDNCR